MGRFSERKFIYELAGPEQTFKVGESTVYFVITPSAGYETLDAPDTIADIRLIQSRLKVNTLIAEHGVWLIEWHPPRNTTSLFLAGVRGASAACPQC